MCAGIGLLSNSVFELVVLIVESLILPAVSGNDTVPGLKVIEFPILNLNERPQEQGREFAEVL